MRILEEMAKWNFNTWVFFSYLVVAVILQVYWFFRITSHTDDLEEQQYKITQYERKQYVRRYAQQN